MKDIESFFRELGEINWLENSGTSNEQYHMVYSIFEAYDNWNKQALDTWEPHICTLEQSAQAAMGDDWIDEVFERVEEAVGDRLWECWGAFIERCNLQEECGLDNEMLDFIIRDVAWAYIEQHVSTPGFFNMLLDIYKSGYFPCSWQGHYPEGRAVVL